MNCPNCHKWNDPDSQFCTTCGTSLSTTSNDTPQKTGIRSHPTLLSALCTAIPIVILSIIGASLAGTNYSVGIILSQIAIGLWGLAFLIAIGFVVAGKRKIATGIFAGISISIIGLGISCFALINQSF